MASMSVVAEAMMSLTSPKKRNVTTNRRRKSIVKAMSLRPISDFDYIYSMEKDFRRLGRDFQILIDAGSPIGI